MLKEALSHMLFIGAVVCAAYFLKKDNTKGPHTMVHTSGIVMDEEHFPYTADTSPLIDTLKQK